MTNDIDVPRQGMSEGAQVVAALVVVACIAVGFWVMAKYQPDPSKEPATCSRSDDKATPSKPVSGVRLCTALNRPDLPALLGTPDDHALSASSNEGRFSESLGISTEDPGATVQLEGYSVKLSEADDDLTIAEIAEYLPKGAERRTVVGHPAFLYSGRTIGILFDDGKSSVGPGGVARTLLVAKDPKDGGGSYEIAIWRQDDAMPDDTALLRVAERVLPTVPGWPTG